MTQASKNVSVKSTLAAIACLFIFPHPASLPGLTDRRIYKKMRNVYVPLSLLDVKKYLQIRVAFFKLSFDEAILMLFLIFGVAQFVYH